MRLKLTRCHPFYAAIPLVICLCCMHGFTGDLHNRACHATTMPQPHKRAAHRPTEESQQHSMIAAGGRQRMPHSKFRDFGPTEWGALASTPIF